MSTPDSVPAGSAKASVGGGAAAALVAAGILASRLFGLVRVAVMSRFLGAGPEADAFTAAFRLPNVMQNLLGEGVLSASFIPEYARLRAKGDDAARRELAGSVLAFLLVICAVLVLVVMLAAPILVNTVYPGFRHDERRTLAIQLVRILAPGTALLVVGGWCLGVLNSHGKFLLSYASGVLWNVAMIAVLLWYGPRVDPGPLVIALAWGSVVGSALQVAVQWPSVMAAVGALRLSLAARVGVARPVFASFGPALLGRGVAQVSGLADLWLASFLATGSTLILGNAQTLYLLPVSLFGMSISAAELPAMASDTALGETTHERLRERLASGMNRLLFFVVPSAVAFLVVGDALATLAYFGGRFRAPEVVWVWMALAGAALGLVAATRSRLSASALYALGDPRTPVRTAIVRVVFSFTLGALGALWLVPRAGLDARLSLACITGASGVMAWVEYFLLARAVRRRVGVGGPPHAEHGGQIVIAALVAGGAALLAKGGVVAEPSRVRALIVCLVFGAVYGAVALALRVPFALQLASGRRRT